MTEVYLGQLSPACAPSRTRNSIEVLLQISGSHPLLLETLLSGRMSSFTFRRRRLLPPSR